MAAHPCPRHGFLRYPVPRGAWNTFELLQIPVTPGAPWPCEENPDVSPYGVCHLPNHTPGGCHQAVALLCEEKCTVFVKLVMPECCAFVGSLVPILLARGMNILVYCEDNMGGGELHLEQTTGMLPVLLPCPEQGGEYYYSGDAVTNMFYTFDSMNIPPPPVAVVVTLDKSVLPIPTLKTLARLATGEIRLTETGPADLPQNLNFVNYLYVTSLYNRPILEIITI